MNMDTTIVIARSASDEAIALLVIARSESDEAIQSRSL
jgi:hypothetical protein